MAPGISWRLLRGYLRNTTIAVLKVSAIRLLTRSAFYSLRHLPAPPFIRSTTYHPLQHQEHKPYDLQIIEPRHSG